MGNYLYNDVSLPPLVGWDGMPPAGIFILHDNRNGTYVLCGVSAAPQCVLVNGEDEPALPFDVFGTVFVASEGAESWGESQNFKPLEYFSATESAYVRQRDVGWLWTQSDILTADGQNIYMAATAPIKVAEDSGITVEDVRLHYRRGYTAGVVFGRNSGGNLEGNSAADVAKASKNADMPAAAYSVHPRDNTPGNYLYNGVELPPLPHWDDMPPFGVFIIYIASEQLYRLYGANDAPFCIKTAGAEKIAFSADIFGSYQKARAGETNWFGLKAFDGNLSDIADFEDGVYILRPENKIIWTKETIFNSDGQSVFLAATEPIKIELPEQLTEADLRRSWRRGMAFGVVIGVVARKISENALPPIVETEWYLYGTPSESGNVALADGDGYVVYDGAALPKLPEWDKEAYPYAYMRLRGYFQIYSKTEVTLIVSATPIAFGGWSFDWGVSGITKFNLKEDTEWSSFSYNETNGTSDISTSKFFWGNHEIVNSSDGSVYLAKSAPIPLASNEPVAAVYNGVKLPPLPEYDKEAYPYVHISDGVIYWFASASPVPWIIKENGGAVVSKEHGVVSYKTSSLNKYGNKKWGEWGDSSMAYDYSAKVKPNWANYDVLNEDGTVYLAKSDPVPVYEQKE